MDDTEDNVLQRTHMLNNGADYGTKGNDESMRSSDEKRSNSMFTNDNMRMESIDISRELEFTNKHIVPESNHRYNQMSSVESVLSNNLYEQYKR